MKVAFSLLVVFHEPRHHARLIALVNQLPCCPVFTDKSHGQCIHTRSFTWPLQNITCANNSSVIVFFLVHVFIVFHLLSLIKLLTCFNPPHTISWLIICTCVTKFSIVIGSPHTYFSRNQRVILGVSNYNLFVTGYPCDLLMGI